MMSQSRFKQVFSGLSSTAQAVYDLVPVQEVWTAQAIYNALRKADMNQSFDVVQGCLRALTTAGVVKESKLGYCREPIRKTPQRASLADLKDVIAEATSPAPPPATPPLHAAASWPKEPFPPAPPGVGTFSPTAPTTIDIAPKEPLMPLTQPQRDNIVDTIGNLAQRLQAMAQRHREEMQDLADLVADAAIEVQAQFEKGEADLAKFRQLQSILKNLN